VWGRDVLERIDGWTDLTAWSLEHGFRVLAEDPSTCVWIVRNLFNAQLGHVTRDRHKVIRTFREVDAPWYAAHGRPTPIRPLWIVEDPMSAAVLGQAICLFGTNLSVDLAAHLHDAGYRSFLVALDSDALNAAQRVAARLRTSGAEVRIVPLFKDVKDMTADERAKLVAAA
jgi:hypothetical protein